jgi:DNA invertase Pin-like site-specific DNA recombinase
MKEAVIYARVSSKEQEQEGYSIPAQLRFLREYAIKNDFRVVLEFVEVESAKVAGRKKFREMLNFL